MKVETKTVKATLTRTKNDFPSEETVLVTATSDGSFSLRGDGLTIETETDAIYNLLKKIRGNK